MIILALKLYIIFIFKKKRRLSPTLKKTSIIHVPNRFPHIQFHQCSKCSPINTKISPISDRKHVTDFHIMTVIKMAEVLKPSGDTVIYTQKGR